MEVKDAFLENTRGEKRVDTCLTAHSVKTPAKINLGLRIVGRRADGYHLLESIFWPVSLLDDLEFRPTSGPAIEMTWAENAPVRRGDFPDETSNIAFRALQGSSWTVRIQKRIPLGAGLGGGSSDAAAVLRFLKDDGKKAETLGADVPFFLNPRPSWVTGVGECRHALTVVPALERSLYFLLVFPPFSSPTAAVFSQYRASNAPFSPRSSFNFHDTLGWKSLREYLHTTQNDLEPAAVQLFPSLGEILARLRAENPLHAALSGSGSTCFAAFETSDARKKTLKALAPYFRSSNCKSVEVETYTAA